MELQYAEQGSKRIAGVSKSIAGLIGGSSLPRPSRSFQPAAAGWERTFGVSRIARRSHRWAASVFMRGCEAVLDDAAALFLCPYAQYV